MSSRTSLLYPILLGLVLLVGVDTTAAADTREARSGPWCSTMLGPAAESSRQGTAPDGEAPGAVVTLRRADYEIDLLGNIALGTLTLEFVNPGEEDVQTTYLGKRPAGLFIDEMRVQVGDDEEQELEAGSPAPDPKKTARRTKPASKSRSRASAPSAGGSKITIPAGEVAIVRARFRQTVPFAGDRFRLALPAVSGECSESGNRRGWPEGRSPQAPLGIKINLRHDQPLLRAESDSHEILVSFEGEQSLVELVSDDPAGDQRFEFEYALGEEDRPVLASYAGPENNGVREVMVVLSPPTDAPPESIRPREVLLVMDSSGSMRGPKIQEARLALVASLEQLNEEDRFNVLEFDSNCTMLLEEPAAFSQELLTDAIYWLDEQVADGGTALMSGLRIAFEQPKSSDHHRLVMVLTDGRIADEAKVKQFLQEHLGDARLFVVGIGHDADPETIQRLAEHGRGISALAREPEQLQAALADLFSSVSAPVAWDLSLDWGGADVVSMRPARVPDLYTGRPVTLSVQVRGDLPPDLLVRASTMEGEQTYQSALPPGGAREYPSLTRSGEGEKGQRGRKGR